MTKYNVSYEKNGVFQAIIVNTDKTPGEIGRYMRDARKAANVYGITLATADDMRPGKPCITL